MKGVYLKYKGSTDDAFLNNYKEKRFTNENKKNQ